MVNKHVVALAYATLVNLKRKIVAVKLIKSPEEFNRIEAKSLQGKLSYCQMVKSASSGHIIKAKMHNFACKSGARALGIIFEDERNSNGESWAKLGLHDNITISKKIRKGVDFLKGKNYGVLVGVADNFGYALDSYIIIAEPYSIMRLIQGYTYHFGRTYNISMMGNMAVCMEATSRPISLDDVNISVFCVGTRHRAGWTDEEMLMGIPASKFEKVVDGLVKTVNIMETDVNKKIIEKNFINLGIDYDVRYSYNYYMEL